MTLSARKSIALPLIKLIDFLLIGTSSCTLLVMNLNIPYAQKKFMVTSMSHAVSLPNNKCWFQFIWIAAAKVYINLRIFLSTEPNYIFPIFITISLHFMLCNLQAVFQTQLLLIWALYTLLYKCFRSGFLEEFKYYCCSCRQDINMCCCLFCNLIIRISILLTRSLYILTM